MAQASNRSTSKQKESTSNSNGTAAGRSVAVGVAAGLVGGAVLGTRLAKKPKRVLGLRVPGSSSRLDGVAKQVGKVRRILP